MWGKAEQGWEVRSLQTSSSAAEKAASMFQDPVPCSQFCKASNQPNKLFGYMDCGLNLKGTEDAGERHFGTTYGLHFACL